MFRSTSGFMAKMLNKKFGYLMPFEVSGFAECRCRCICGNEVIVKRADLLNGNVISCGCIPITEKEIKRSAEKYPRQATNKTHGESNTALYDLWSRMRYSCNNQKSKSYQHYGARGIEVCSAWNEAYEPFRNWALRNGYIAGMTVDRIDKNGPFAPDNCCIVPKSQRKRPRS